MRRTLLAACMLSTFLLSGCRGEKADDNTPVSPPQTECIVKYTPVKDQGESSLCWMYAMLATIESEHLMRGDSVNLSPHFVARHMLELQAEQYYLSDGRKPIVMRGVCSQLIDLIMRNGICQFDSYKSQVNYNVLSRKVEELCKTAISRRIGVKQLKKQLGNLLDKEIRPDLRYVFLYGAEYTPQEFSRSVCRDDEYVALTSFTHHPFGEKFVLEVPDNHGHYTFLNLPLDTLTHHIEQALRNGHPVCWEGDTSEALFSFAEGRARLVDDRSPVTQEKRQYEFERFNTTDDHCMEIIGIARTPKGKKYFICKNSWGTENPFKGLMYMSENYLRAKTVGVWMTQEAFNLSSPTSHPAPPTTKK